MKILLLLQYQNGYSNYYQEILNSILNFIFSPVLLLLLLVWFLLKKKVDNLHSHWNTLIDGFDFSTQDFYSLLENELQDHGIDDIEIKETTLKEGGIGTDSRLYLKVTWKNLQYFVCAAPFGDGFFVSWWLKNNASLVSVLISKIPFIGGWLHKKLFPVTFYKVDTASMFMTYAQQSVLKVIGEITKDTGIKEMSEAAKKPIMADIFKR